MDFARKNFVTLMVVGATIALAGVAVFTALRLYQLRRDPVTPVRPASTPSAGDAPVSISPQSGNWNHPESFLVTNITDESVSVVWQLDCWDDLLCSDDTGEETLAPGESFEQGFGVICSQWQLNLNYTGTSTDDASVWDYAGVAEVGPECDVVIEDVTEAGTESLDEGTDEDLATEDEEQVETTDFTAQDFTTQACSTFSFSLSDEVQGIGGGNTPDPTVSLSPTSTAVATATPTLAPTATPVKTAVPELPEAGIATPTIIGIGAGALMLIFALVLAI